LSEGKLLKMLARPGRRFQNFFAQPWRDDFRTSALIGFLIIFLNSLNNKLKIAEFIEGGEHPTDLAICRVPQEMLPFRPPSMASATHSKGWRCSCRLDCGRSATRVAHTAGSTTCAI